MATTASFDALRDGTAVERIDLTAGTGDRRWSAAILTYGATLQSLHVPAPDGEPVNVVLGYDDLASYVDAPGYLGATIGRYGNRIAGAAFKLDGSPYRLGRNFLGHNLHGGPDGFDKRVWTVVDSVDDGTSTAVTLSLRSPDGDQGFPGALAVEVTYALSATDDGAGLTISYRAAADRPTVVNLTNHSYFNLAGHGDIGDHELAVTADRYLPVDAELIPTGDRNVVDGTVFDLRRPRRIGDGLAGSADEPQLAIAGGYDHCYVLADAPRPEPELAAVLTDPASGRTMQVATTEPGVQVYTGNNLTEDANGYPAHAAVCLETQHFPNSPNEPEFPSTVVSPGTPYKSQTAYTFSER